jgi:hypothetical protein
MENGQWKDRMNIDHSNELIEHFVFEGIGIEPKESLFIVVYPQSCEIIHKTFFGHNLLDFEFKETLNELHNEKRYQSSNQRVVVREVGRTLFEHHPDQHPPHQQTLLSMVSLKISLSRQSTHKQNICKNQFTSTQSHD